MSLHLKWVLSGKIWLLFEKKSSEILDKIRHVISYLAIDRYLGSVNSTS